MNNKSKKLIVAAFVLMLICASFAACGGSDSSDDPVVGTWQLNQVSALGQDMSADDFMKAANYEDKEIPSVTFNGDNTVSVDMLGVKGTGEWELKDGKYHVTDDTSSTLDFTLENNVLSVEQSGATLEFAKQQ